jgi:Tol biopolymer transport system component
MKLFRFFPLLTLVLLILMALIVGGRSAASPGATERVSVDSSGNQGNAGSGINGPAISADGRYVAFQSWASNLVPGDTNGTEDVFVHDRQTAATERVSLDSSGNQGNSGSGIYEPAISADGRYVAFESWASNLVPGDSNGNWDIFVHDRQTGATERVSVDSSGNQGNSASYRPAVSADGRYVAFHSVASNLVEGDANYCCDYNGDTIYDQNCFDVFVHDRQTGATERVSVNSSGNEASGNSGFEIGGAAISGDGRLVAFASDASNLVGNDTNDAYDVFVHDRQTGVTERVSVDSAGNQGNGRSGFPSLSADGRYVAFQSWASNLVPGDTNGTEDVFVHDRQTGVTERVSVDSQGNQVLNGGWGAAASADGRFVTFQSNDQHLVPGDTNGTGDVFVRDRQTAATERVSVDSAGNQGNGFSGGSAISADGRYVAFRSDASNLVPSDTNGCSDLFLRDLGDADADGEWDPFDNCPTVANPGQADADSDGAGDVCDACPDDPNNDADNDGICVGSGYLPPTTGDNDNCPTVANPGQDDFEADGVGDACDDSDGDSQGQGEPPFFVDGKELFMGTDPLDNCPDDPSDDAWPPDFNNTGSVTSGDLVLFRQHYEPLGGLYEARYDLNASGSITSGDLVVFRTYYGSNCTP